MILYPAIDLRDGNCVRLYQGDYDVETIFNSDPASQARQFATEGTSWIHVVDLDAARTGHPENRDHVLAIAAAVGPEVRVQTGGGVRSLESASILREAGVARVIVGTAAAEAPELVDQLVAEGHRVAVGLDVRGREVATRGWEKGSGLDLVALLERFAGGGADAAIITQISQDGTLEGPDLEGLALAVEATDLPVIASGGVGTLDHLRQLDQVEGAGRRLDGVIVGRALYEGVFTVTDALRVLGGSSS